MNKASVSPAAGREAVGKATIPTVYELSVRGRCGVDLPEPEPLDRVRHEIRTRHRKVNPFSARPLKRGRCHDRDLHPGPQRGGGGCPQPGRPHLGRWCAHAAPGSVLRMHRCASSGGCRLAVPLLGLQRASSWGRGPEVGVISKQRGLSRAGRRATCESS